MKVTQWLVAATLLFTLGGVANAQDDVTLPSKGTTEYSVSGNVFFDNGSSWNLDVSWGPFTSPNLQWGLNASVIDLGDGFDTTGLFGPFVNWYFPTEGSNTLPYVGAGIAFAFGEGDGSVWNVHAGLKQMVSSSAAIFAELQYQDFSEGGNQTGINLGISLFR